MSADRMILEAELLPFLKERLASGQCVRYLPFRGVSMLPLLRQKTDAVELSPLPEKLRKYDLPVYRYPNGKVVMHRIVDVADGYYICLGDNTYSYEKVLPEYCIALVTAIRRGNRTFSVEEPWYRIYSRIWVALYPLRKVTHGFIVWLRRSVKAILFPKRANS